MTTPRKAAPGSTVPAERRNGSADKDAPLVDDIRLLGRILGDVIREQEGRAAYDLVERVRQLAVAYRLRRDARAGRALDRLLKGLSGDQTVSVIRAFSFFSHLANIAEDRHHLRRRAHHERQGHLQDGSLGMAFERLARGGISADADRADPRARLDLARPDGTPHRGAAQEHPRRRARDRRAGRGARAPRRARSGAQHRAAAGPRHPALADAGVAPDQADRRRRDRERAELLPHDLPDPDSAALRGSRGGASRSADRELLPHGEAGSAATATAIRSSPPRRCASRSSARARRCCAST